MQEAWIPVTGLDQMAANLVTLTPTSKSDIFQCEAGTCTPGGTGFTPLSLPAQQQGARNLFSQMDLGDGAAYLFPAVDLVNAAGTPVGPTAASIAAAVHDMNTNPDGITQYSDDTTTDKKAYPLAMVDYAMVPTCGLKPAEASAIAEFLTRVATTGQTSGVAPGDLAPGYYPLTSKQKAQTLLAATQVRAQDCKSAPADTTVSGKTGVNDVGPLKGAAKSGSTAHRAGKAGAKASVSPSAAGTPASTLRNAAFGVKSPDSTMTGILLLLAMICGSLAVVGAPAAWLLTATGKWPVVIRWLHAGRDRTRALRRLFRPARRI